MMTPRRTLGFLVLIALAMASSAPAGFCQQGMMRGRRYHFYNSKTETTVTGIIEEVTRVRPQGRRGWGGIHLDLKTASGKFDVEVGPATFLASEKFQFAKGDKVQVTGSRITYQGHDIILAREIRMDGRTLTLRDADGIPTWSGGRRR